VRFVEAHILKSLEEQVDVSPACLFSCVELLLLLALLWFTRVGYILPLHSEIDAKFKTD
jgi:hypothetical protein